MTPLLLELAVAAGTSVVTGVLSFAVATIEKHGVYRRPPRRVRPLSLDVRRGKVSGCVRITEPRDGRMTGRIPGFMGYSQKTMPIRDLRFAGVAMLARTDDGRTIRIELAQAEPALTEDVREDFVVGLEGDDLRQIWRFEAGDVVELRGRVLVDAPDGGYRGSGEDAWTIRARQPESLTIRLLGRGPTTRDWVFAR